METHKQYYPPKQSSLESGSNSFMETASLMRTDKDFIIKDLYRFGENEAALLTGLKVNRTIIATLVTGAVYSVTTSDYLLGVTDLSYAPIIGLPRPKLVGNGKTYIVKDEVGGAATTTITIISQGEEIIDGASSKTITNNYEALQFYSDGAKWFIY